MKNENIAEVIGKIAQRHIEEAARYDTGFYVPAGSWKPLQKTAACIAVIVLALVGSSGIAFAASIEFRNAVLKLFSGFTEKEKAEMEHGHLTGKTDKTDTLLVFLDKFNAENMGNGKKVKFDDGYDYTFFNDGDGNICAAVVCESDEYRLLVNMEQENTAQEAMGWYVSSCQFISKEQAEELLRSRILKQSEDKETAADYGIKAEKSCGKIYNALHNAQHPGEKIVISLTEKETQDLKKILDAYRHDENEYGDGTINKYAVKFDDADYMITENGSVSGTRNHKAAAFQLTGKDLEKVMALFHKYGIPD